MLTPPIPTAPMKSLGANAFSASNKQILQQNIQDALEAGFKATFIMGPGEDGDEIAKKFAMNAAPNVAAAIDDYVKNMLASLNILITPASLANVAGPVAGVMSTMTDIQILP